MLEETEAAVGGADMKEEHATLNKLGNDLRTLQGQYENREKNIEETSAKVESLRKDYDRFQQQKTALAKLKIMKQKKLWLEYNERKTDFDTAKKISQEKKKELAVSLPARWHRCCHARALNASRPPGCRLGQFLIHAPMRCRHCCCFRTALVCRTTRPRLDRSRRR